MLTVLTPTELEARLNADGHTELASLLKQIRQGTGVLRVDLDKLVLKSDPWMQGYAAGAEAAQGAPV